MSLGRGRVGALELEERRDSEGLGLALCFPDLAFLWQAWLVGAQGMPVGAGVWTNRMIEKVRGVNLCEPLESGSRGEGKPQQVV